MVAALPLSLLALLFACPLVLGANESEEQRSSPNDPFRALALQKPKPKADEHPVCCLRPLSAPEPVDDGMLLSFEEWKMKQLASEAVPVSLPKLNTSNGTDPLTERPSGDTPIPPTEDTPTPADWDPHHPHDSLDLLLSQPQFRVPLTDRFNYASLDCSARVHTAHRSAKSPSSILSSKKDRYMLSPCDKTREKQFVVVELCEDIRIDTVQLANFEFFSGVFKDFTVSVSKTYTTSPEDWTVVATYRAKNVRGVQSFRWPTSSSSRDFYRFIRIDFLSHYGTEYYCPVSLLRVYGLTHLEEWKWEVWEAESRQRLVEAQRRGVLALPATEKPVVATVPVDVTVPAVVEPTVISSEAAAERNNEASSAQNTAVPSPNANRSNLKAYIPENHISQAPSTPTTEPISSSSSSPASHTTPSQSHPQEQNQNQNQAKEHYSTDTYASSSHSSSASSPPPNISVSGSVQSIPTQNIPSSTSSSSASVPTISSVSQKASTASGSATAPNVNASSTPAPSISTESSVQAASSASSTSASISISSAAISSSDATASTPTPTIIVSLPSPSVQIQQPQQQPQVQPSPPSVPAQQQSHQAPPAIPASSPPSQPYKPLPPSSTGGESIYRTILNKLADVELNQTLHMRYVELQHARVREGLRRLGEDVGRLEGGTRAQSAKYQRTLDEWDRQRYQLEMEYGELISRIEYLSEEITLEKRLGVAQLLLLLAVLIFMGLTRGSRAETPSPTPAMTSNRQRLREWGRRHFRLSGDWDWRFGRKKESGSGTESDTRTERVPGPPRTPSPLPGDGNAKRMKSGKHVPARLPLDGRSPYDDEDENPILFPSTSQPYISTRKNAGSRTQNRNQPLTPISLNALPTAPVSLSLSQSYSYSSSRSENRHTVRQRTSSNPRSRAPSLRSTPRRTHVHAQHPFARPVTPTSATFLHHHPQAHPHPHQPFPVQLRPQMLQRSSSHGMGVGVGVGGVGMLPSASWGSVLGAGAAAGSGGNVPKSARKWARTAHLHEVKSVVGGGGRGKGNGKGKEKEHLVDSGKGEEGDDVFSSTSRPQLAAEEQQQQSPQPLNSLLLKLEEAENGAEHEEDGDTWVDTDSVGGSELDVEAEVEVEANDGRFAGGSSTSHSRSRDLVGVGPDSLVKPPLIPFPSA